MPKRNRILFTLGLSVRRAREAKQRSQEKLAERAILDPTYIGGIERGLRNPDIRNIARPAKALGPHHVRTLQKSWTHAWETQR